MNETTAQRPAENKMGVMPINRLLITMSLPMIISMLVQALYNIVDSMFVAQLSENALTAVSLAFPVQSLMIAVGSGTGVGINALLSKSLGEKNFDLADKTAENGIFLAVLSYLLFAVIGVLFSKPFFLLQTTDPEIVENGAILALLFNIKKNEEITLRLKGFRPNAKVIGKIYSVGIPSIIMASIGSVMTFGMNKILISFTSTATAVFGVYFKLQSFVFMPIFGLNNGMVPIISYNYGARKPDRMMKTIKLSILYATCIMIIGVAIFMLIPDKLLSIFNASETMQQIGVPALRTISLSFVFAGFSICMLSVCQSLGHGMLSLSVSVVRQLVILLPTAYLLARFSGLNAVWWAFPFAELFSLALCLIYFRYIYGKEIKPLGNAS